MADPRERDPVTGQFLIRHGKSQGNLKHGAVYYLRTGRLPSVRGRRLLARSLREFEKDLRGSLGENLTPQREALMRQVLRCENVLRLIELYLLRASPMKPGEFRRGKLELQPCLANSYGHYLNVQRQALMALGLEGVEPRVETLESIIAEYDRKAEEGTGTAEDRARMTQDGRSQGQGAADQSEGDPAGAAVQGGDKPADGEGPGEAGQKDGEGEGSG